MDILTSSIAPSLDLGGGGGMVDSSTLLWILIVGFVVAFFLAFGVGANDVANSFGTSVGSKVLTLRQACVLATIFETLGAVLIGYKVSDTVRKGIFDVDIYRNDEKTLMLGCLSALLGSAVWNILATFLALPISGTHSIVGAMAGFTVVARGIHSINWLGLAKIVSSWFVSPVLSGVLSAAIFYIVYRCIIHAQNPIRNGLVSLPFFYFGTLFINFFSVFLDGPQVLRFDMIPAWGAFVISTLLSMAGAVFVWFFLVPRLKAANDAKKPPTKGMFSKGNTANGTLNGDHANNNTIITATNGTDKRECHVNVGYENTEMEAVNGSASSKANLTQLQDNNMNNMVAAVEQQQPVDAAADEAAEVNKLFSFLQVLTAIFGSFAHGGNDVSNAIGPLVSLWLIYSDGNVAQKSETPLWILLFGGLGICVGLWVYGQKVIRTVGENLTKISPSNGFSIEIGAASTVLLASKIGLPISTTHCKVGSIVFVGFFNKDGGGVNWGLFKGIIAAWVFTLPITAGLSALIMFVLQTFV